MIRVFPRKTKWTPNDELAFIGSPPLFRPPNQPVKISVCFTWDIDKGKKLLEDWKQYYSDVKIGGPAFGDPGGEFEPSLFTKKGFVITSRGCIRKCPWCFVPQREGSIKELKIREGWEINDNNLLACSKRHIIDVFEMLKRQPQPINFAGGLDARLFEDWHVRLLDDIRIQYLWFACDYPGAEKTLERVADILGHIKLGKKRCYVLVGYNGESLREAETRLENIFRMGFLPFAMLYRDQNQIRYDPDWARFLKKWCRPAWYRSVING